MILKYCVALQYNTLSRVELDKGLSSLENKNTSESVSCSVVSNSLQSYALQPSGFSVHGILQARMLEWVAISFSRGSSQPRSSALQTDLLSEPPRKPQSRKYEFISKNCSVLNFLYLQRNCQCLGLEFYYFLKC